MTTKRKEQICALLKGIETGDPESVAVVHPERYVQHNPQTHEGGEGLAALFKRLSKSSPHVNIVRVFSDGDFVFAHTEYDFSTRRIGFEVFRFEGDFAVEHWDNIQPRRGPNASGHTMVDGPTEVTAAGQTEVHRELVRAFVEEVLIGRRLDQLARYAAPDLFTEHNPRLRDGTEALRKTLAGGGEGGPEVQYEKCHRVLADGEFVLTVCEGRFGGVHTSFYDLFRCENGKLMEHWDTTEAIPPLSEWKNDNGKF